MKEKRNELIRTKTLLVLKENERNSEMKSTGKGMIAAMITKFKDEIKEITRLPSIGIQ